MGYTIPNEATAGYSDQARPDERDFKDILVPAFAGTGVVTGGAATPTGIDRNITMAASTVKVAGVDTAIAGAVVTPAAGHATLPRFDLIVANASGYSVVAGTAATIPVLPDPAGKTVYYAVYMPAASTVIGNAQLVDKRVFVPNPVRGVTDVRDYGAAGNGTTDDTTAVTNALAAAVAAGNTLYFPPGTYLVGAITITTDVTIRGAGWASKVKLKNSTNDYAFKFSPPGGGIKADIADLSMDGNASNQTAGGCIYAAGAVQSRFDNIHFENAKDVCLYLYQISAGVIGHHNRVTRCLFDNLNSVAGNQQGIRIQGNDENYIAFCDFENWGGSTPGSEPYAIKDWSGLQVIIGNVFVGGQEAIRIQDAASTRIIGNTFDGPGRACIHASGSKNVIQGNLFSGGGSSSSGAYAQLEIDNSTSCTVVGNAFTVTSSGVVRNCVYELSSSSDNTIIEGNNFDLTGGSLFGSNPIIERHGAHTIVSGNTGLPEIAFGAATSNALQNSGVFVTRGLGTIPLRFRVTSVAAPGADKTTMLVALTRETGKPWQMATLSVAGIGQTFNLARNLPALSSGATAPREWFMGVNVLDETVVYAVILDTDTAATARYQTVFGGGAGNIRANMQALGTLGNLFSVTFVNPGTASSPLSVSSPDGYEFRVSLETNGASAIVTTPGDLITAWAVSGSPWAVYFDNNVGTNPVQALAKTSLAGGVDGPVVASFVVDGKVGV